MKTKTKLIIGMCMIFALILCYVIGGVDSSKRLDGFESVTDWDDTNLGSTGKYSVCCVNADGYCLDLFESQDDRCGENNRFISEEFCYHGNVPQCEKGSCLVDGVLQKIDMNYFECEKIYIDSGASDWSWQHS